ncbi:splicing factor, Prp19-binding domain-containing protein [Pseudomassariella vexata]|uniref:Splicing factor, Prp19-binding domain-domain-containing protein n=1 Tax=Pseudomassariella vexata TaxID=1141098 RepID=A0A1Y2EK79_9PEZI|nr:splicing factor, Prp19-binding domain-containing protein [Pseudomassariella vexata]ORY71940.1 splicing factor, Prp19-binding domain-domain-containing protein [Pseudomassariella vexata]
MPIKPARPLRHRAGKVLDNSSSSESEASDVEETPVVPPSKATSASKIASGNLNKVDLNERRRIAQQQEEKRKAAELAARAAAEEEEGFVTEEEEQASEDGEEESSDDDEEEEEESSEDEVPRRAMMMRPKFVPKSQRNGNKTAEQEAAEAAAKEADEVARKKADADAMIEEQIRRDLAAKKAGKNFWDDAIELESDVDTSDEVDPEAEQAAWKVRELKRLKREREAVEEREKEREELERRRNLTEEERAAQDAEKIARQREEKESRGKMAYLGQYHHKGAFYQEEMAAEGLDKRDLMGAKVQDEVDRSLLPKALQMRDMTKVGKKGATKYRDLKSEDTGRWGEFRDHRPGKGRDFGGGWDVDERFRSDRDREREGPGGANAIPLGDRKTERPRSRERGRYGKSNYRPRDEDERRRERSRSGSPPRKRERSRSRSPRRDSRDRHDYSRRKRDPSRDADRYDSDKRRRVDTR